MNLGSLASSCWYLRRFPRQGSSGNYKGGVRRYHAYFSSLGEELGCKGVVGLNFEETEVGTKPLRTMLTIFALFKDKLEKISKKGKRSGISVI